MKIYIVLLVVILTNNFNTKIFAQQKQVGLPYITNFEMKDYKFGAQNWAFVQDKRGVLYVGNTDGLLEFDGISWRQIKLPNMNLAI